MALAALIDTECVTQPSSPVLDISASNPVIGFHGAVTGRRLLEGAEICFVSHPAHHHVAAHAHDWPVLSLSLIGGYEEETQRGRYAYSGACAVYHPAGSAHADIIGPGGLETINITFDPDWIAGKLCRPLPQISSALRGGSLVRRAVRSASKTASGAASGAMLHQTMIALLAAIGACDQPEARAHRRTKHHADGKETHAACRRRLMVEEAVLALRMTNQPIAEVAIGAGFCDQSHMNRVFRALLGRTPLTVRREAASIYKLRDVAAGSLAAPV